MEVWIVHLPFSSGNLDLSDSAYGRCLEQLDQASQARVKRFYRREDAWRSLIGMLLPRALLRRRGIPLDSVRFSRTQAGKPFIGRVSNVGYNISHDNGIIAMISRIEDGEDTNKVGVDIMRRALPKGETVHSFLRAIEDTITSNEMKLFTPGLEETTAIRYIFLLWTIKEAYTKALGLGLGFDFKRIEYNIEEGKVFVDCKLTQGWDFQLFELKSTVSCGGHPEVYQGATAQWMGGEETNVEMIPNIEEDKRFYTKEVDDLIGEV